MGVQFVARVTCDRCGTTAELGVASTVDNTRCNWAGCGCVPGEPEISDAYERGWQELPGELVCPACWAKGL